MVDDRLFGVLPGQMPREHLIVLGSLQNIVLGEKCILPAEPDVLEQDFPVAVEDPDGLAALCLHLHGHLIPVRPEQDVGRVAPLDQRFGQPHLLNVVGVLGHVQQAGPRTNDEYLHRLLPHCLSWLARSASTISSPDLWRSCSCEAALRPLLTTQLRSQVEQRSSSSFVTLPSR